jgi:hypothetical protein
VHSTASPKVAEIAAELESAVALNADVLIGATLSIVYVVVAVVLELP